MSPPPPPPVVATHFPPSRAGYIVLHTGYTSRLNERWEELCTALRDYTLEPMGTFDKRWGDGWFVPSSERDGAACEALALAARTYLKDDDGYVFFRCTEGHPEELMDLVDNVIGSDSRDLSYCGFLNMSTLNIGVTLSTSVGDACVVSFDCESG